MAKIPARYQFSNLTSLGDVTRYLDQFAEDVLTAINGNLRFDKNINTKTYSVTFAQANTEVSISHALGRVPGGYIVTSSSVACRVYNGTTSNTDKILYLKSDTPATVGIKLF